MRRFVKATAGHCRMPGPLSTLMPAIWKRRSQTKKGGETLHLNVVKILRAACRIEECSYCARHAFPSPFSSLVSRKNFSRAALVASLNSGIPLKALYRPSHTVSRVREMRIAERVRINYSGKSRVSREKKGHEESCPWVQYLF